MPWPSQLSDVSRTGFELAQDLGFTSFKFGSAVAATAKLTLLLSRRNNQSMKPVSKLILFIVLRRVLHLLMKLRKCKKMAQYFNVITAFIKKISAL